jgi:hypothetical protein
MANTIKKRIKSTRLCAGDLKAKVAIQTRDLIESDFDSAQPVELFTTVRYQYCAIESAFGANGVARFDGINILEEATHIFWAMWDASFPDIEDRNHYLLFKNKRYRCLKVDNLNERDITLAIQVTERGEDSQEATKA